MWNALVGDGAMMAYACVWTGNPDSPESEWYDPWVLNINKAVKLGKDIIVVGKDGESLGYGQGKEIRYLNEKNIK